MKEIEFRESGSISSSMSISLKLVVQHSAVVIKQIQ